MTKPSASLALPLRKTWFLFAGFLAANCLLSYSTFSLETKLWIGLFGLVLPIALALTHRSSARPPKGEEFLPSVSPWVFILLLLLSVFLRFHRLTTLSLWPNYDDAAWGWLGLRFRNGWGWHLIYPGCNFPAAYLWGLGLWFKAFQPGLTALWAFPALLSALTVPFSYWAARQFFSRSLSLAVGTTVAFGFWPLLAGRICDQMVLVVLWEFLFFGFLGLYAKDSRKTRARWGKAVGLGLLLAGGFYIYISWVPVAVIGGALLLGTEFSRKRKDWRLPILVLLSAFVFLAPLLSAGLGPAFGSCVSGIGASPLSGWTAGQWRTSLSYVTALFWSMDSSTYTYQPVWGGFLNPVLSSLFFLGVLALFKSDSKWGSWGFLAALALCVLPGMLTKSLEPFRMIQAIPFLGLGCAWGAGSLLRGLPAKKAVNLALGLLLSFASLDAFHLFGKYHQLWLNPANWRGYSKSIERFHARPILEKKAQEDGPGFLFDGFLPGLCDPSLAIACDSFNAAGNPGLSPKDAHWAALLVDGNLQPFLRKRYPQGRAFFLSDNLGRPDGGWMLWCLPVTPAITGDLERWSGLSQAFDPSPLMGAGEQLQLLLKAYPAYQGDPFLESCYWEKVSDLYLRSGNFQDLAKPLEALRLAVQRGYPSAHLYLKLGYFSLQSGNREKAREYLEKAVRAPGNRTRAAEDLKNLGLLKTKPSPKP